MGCASKNVAEEVVEMDEKMSDYESGYLGRGRECGEV